MCSVVRRKSSLEKVQQHLYACVRDVCKLTVEKGALQIEADKKSLEVSFRFLYLGFHFKADLCLPSSLAFGVG